MKIHCMRLATTLAVAGAACTAAAQVSAPTPDPGASVSAAAPPTGPRPMTPAQAREGASLPSELRPERQVTPQISIPLGKAPPTPLKLPTRPATGGNAAPVGGVDDAAARCESQSGEQVRAKCRDKLAHDVRSR